MAVLYALQLHLVAVVAVPIVMIVGAVTFREARPVRGVHAWVIVAAAVLAIAPYALAEIMTGGANESETFVIQTISMAFKYYKLGLASAMAVVLLVLILLVTWLQRRIVPDETVNLS